MRLLVSGHSRASPSAVVRVRSFMTSVACDVMLASLPMTTGGSSSAGRSQRPAGVDRGQNPYLQGRLDGTFRSVWNEPDHDAFHRGGAVTEAGRQVVAPMPAR